MLGILSSDNSEFQKQVATREDEESVWREMSYGVCN